MKITEAIAALQKVLDKHGDVDVFFDCPSCAIAFTPGYVATAAAHVKGKKEKHRADR